MNWLKNIGAAISAVLVTIGAIAIVVWTCQLVAGWMQ